MLGHLVTRSPGDQEPFASDLRALGREVYFDPVFNIAIFSRDNLDVENVQAILFTSANGVRAFVQNCKTLDLPAFCVGDSSADIARQAGFDDVTSANGDVTDLADLVTSKLYPSGGGLLHPAASKLAGNLQENLVGRGFGYHREILYEAKASEALQNDTKNLFKLRKINELSFFSPRSSKIFLKLLKKADLGRTLAGCTAYCLSEAVAKNLRDVPGLLISVSDQPTRQAMIKLVASNN